MRYMRYIVIIIVFLITFFYGFNNSFSQEDRTKLSNIEINQILNIVDTLSDKLNYHVLLRPVEKNIFHVHIWINERLGETMFSEEGLNICRFYSYNEALVFVYEFQKCKCNVKSKYLRSKSTDPYDYLNESPFYVESGFSKALLVKRFGNKLELTELEFIKEDNFENALKEKF
jgi:hypothetical protein